MAENTNATMARGRALMTDYERESLNGDHGDQRKYEAVSRIRARITDELARDVAIMADENPDLLKDLREVVCEDK
jgi:hypothetical protein